MPANGCRIRENLKSLPVPSGVQNFCTAPCGKYTYPRRGLMLAAVSAHAVPAGIMASSSGSAMTAPAPLRTVRRDRCFLVRNMAWSPVLGRSTQVGRLCRHRRRRRSGGCALAESVALHNPQYDRFELVIVVRGLVHDVAHAGHVDIVHW